MAIVDGKIRCSRCREAEPLSDFRPSTVRAGRGYCCDCARVRAAVRRARPGATEQQREYMQQYARTEEFRARRKELRASRLDAEQEKDRAWYRANRAKVKDQFLRRKYGISSEDLRRFVDQQGGRCGCCGEGFGDFGPVVDHCHEIGAFRGVLCSSCNLGIGSLGDNADGVARALEYLGAAAMRAHISVLTSTQSAPRAHMEKQRCA